MKNNNITIILIIIICIVAILVGIGIGIMLTNNNSSDNTNNANNANNNTNNNNNSTTNNNSTENDSDIINESVETLENGNKKITKTYNTNKVIYEYTRGVYDFELISLSINNNIISESNYHFNTLEVDTFKEFVIVRNSSGGTCGSEDFNIIIYDYNGKQIFKNETIANDIDKLVFNGMYSYNENTNILELNYHLSCDLDCNVCKELVSQGSSNVTCSSIEKYKNSISEGKYNLTYLGNGKFTELSLVSKTTLYEDEYYNHVFTKCI